jgi:transaldolase
VTASDKSQLAQLAGMTTLSIDSGDLKVIEDYAKTGYITDATTNPLFVSQVSSACSMLRFIRFYT